MWVEVSKCDPHAKMMSLRHYSRIGQHDGQTGREIGPSGQKIILLTPDKKALWGSHRPAPWSGVRRQDGFDGWCCFIYRNEGTDLATTYDLIVEAVSRTCLVWGTPNEGFITYIGCEHVGSSNPGGCFQAVGFRRQSYVMSKKLGRLKKMVMPRERCRELAAGYVETWLAA